MFAVTNLARLRSRVSIHALIAGDLISQFGNAITTIGLPWFVYQTTGSATQTGLVFLMLFLPMPIFSFAGGGLVDRFDRRSLSIVADLISGLSVAAIPLLHFTIGLEFWQLLVLVFAGAILDGPGFAARRSLVPTLAENGGVSLERANAAFQFNWSLSMVIGPALAGVLVSWLGASAVLWIDAATFVASACVVGLFVPKVGSSDQDPTSEKEVGTYWSQLMEGVRWITADRLLLQVLVTASLTMTVIAALLTVITPVYTAIVYDSAVSLGVLVASFGLGSLMGSTLYGRFADRLLPWTTYLASTCLIGLTMFALAFRPDLVMSVGLFGVAGLAFGPIIPVMDTLLQRRTPDHLRGRVFSTRFALNNAVKLPGIVLVGLTLDELGPALTLAALGFLLVGPTGYLLLREPRQDSLSHLGQTRDSVT